MTEQKKPEAPKDIPLTACKSTAVTGFGYDAPSETLVLQYKGGKSYRYDAAPPEIHAALIKASDKGESIGKFVASNIAGKFRLAK